MPSANIFNLEKSRICRTVKGQILEKNTISSVFVLIHFAVKMLRYLLTIVHFMNMQIKYA